MKQLGLHDKPRLLGGMKAQLPMLDVWSSHHNQKSELSRGNKDFINSNSQSLQIHLQKM